MYSGEALGAFSSSACFLLDTIRLGNKTLDMDEIFGNSEFVSENLQATVGETAVFRGEIFGVDESAFKKFENLLDEKPTYNKGISELLNKRSPWE